MFYFGKGGSFFSIRPRHANLAENCEILCRQYRILFSHSRVLFSILFETYIIYGCFHSSLTVAFFPFLFQNTFAKNVAIHFVYSDFVKLSAVTNIVLHVIYLYDSPCWPSLKIEKLAQEIGKFIGGIEQRRPRYSLICFLGISSVSPRCVVGSWWWYCYLPLT